ncbi:MAG: SCO family protein [Flavobacteriales bacterium]
MKKYKGLLAIIILILPTAIYVFLTYGKHNFAHLPYVGPETDSTYHSIPDFAFVNQFNDTISQSDYEGNIYLANFVFTTCPTICPVMTYNMRRVQQKMAQYPNFKILSHTVFPEYDTPEVLLEYANKMEADLSNWNFVTGNREDIYSIANSYFVNVMEDSTAQGGFLHSEYFVLVDKEGRIRARDDDNGNNIGVYDGTDDYEVGLLIDDIKVLMAEYNLAKKDKNESKR